MQVSLMVAITNLFRKAVELNELTNFCSFIRLAGHVNAIEFEIASGKVRPHYHNKIYSVSISLSDEDYRKEESAERVQQIINLIDYMIVREQESYEYDPQFDDYVWDADRIEATKTLLFHEYIAGRGM